MRGRYFRYLFENLGGGLCYTGSIYDKEESRILNFIYMTGSCCMSVQQKEWGGSHAKEDDFLGAVDILVIGSYSEPCINKLIDIVKSRETKFVILPYLAPIQRLILAEELKKGGAAGKEAVQFLQDPYDFLKKCGIGNVYFLFGNGEGIFREPEELERVFCFESADKEKLRLIHEMEGYAVPAVRAGYIVESDFLFYFGVYGWDVKIFSDFTREYFSHIENIHEISKNAGEDYESQMRRLVSEFARRFGNAPVTTITMFAGPLHTLSAENDSFMMGGEFGRGLDSEKWERCRKDGRCNCVIKCTYGKDHDVMQHHKRHGAESKFGVWMLGNVNLNRYLSEILARYEKVLPRIRGIGVPNCANGEEWNGHIVKFLDRRDRIYWICGKHDITSAGVVSDIVLSAANHRFLPVDRDWGCCLSGYIIPKED